MDGLLTQTRVLAAEGMTAAARQLDPAAPSADPGRLRFRPDGKGGELASPYPIQAGLSPQALSDAVSPHPWFSRVYPSGDWLAFDLSGQWLELLRQETISPRPLSLPPVPPLPSGEWRILPEHWRLCCIMGLSSPETAGALDGRNPAFVIQYALRRARLTPGCTQESRWLVLLCAAAAEALKSGTPKSLCFALHRLAQAFLLQPGEDAAVEKTLSAGLSSLGIYRNFT